MTSTDIINKIKADPYFAMSFAVDNNFVGIQKALMTVTGKTAATPKDAYDAMVKIYQSSGGNLIIQKIFDATPYINGATNGTGGMNQYFMVSSAPSSRPSTPQTRSVWDGLLTGLGAGLVGFAAADAGTNTNTAASQAAAAAAAKTAADAAAAKKKQNIIIWSIVGGVVVLIGLYLAFGGKKEESAAA